jgi:aspartate/methionine/tyrosine aminotransferase
MKAAPEKVESLGAFRRVPYMGVIWVVAEAMKLGFRNGDPRWCNLGQGQPEVGELPGAPPRIRSVELEPQDQAYGPLGGHDEIRECIASHYNRSYRGGGAATYSGANVGVAMGGRLALTRIMAAFGASRIGYQRPDYTAYQDMFETHLARLTPVPVLAPEETGFAITPEIFERAVVDERLDAFLLSNPCNPTGRVVQGDDLRAIVETARTRGVALVLDEFYSHFIFTEDGRPADRPVSGARFVVDPERDPVVIVDGLTKSFRYPGWRVGWTIGPSDVVEAVGRTASAIDGGPSTWAQRAALKALEPTAADGETTTLRRVFADKRNVMVERLEALGVRFARRPNSTFYCWGTLEDLPEPLNDALTFFRRALEKKVLTVPGRFFDVNPGGLLEGPSPFEGWMRFSFGPPKDNMILGLDRLQEIVEAARRG